ncbi:hypothetical protein BZA05DRAFT_342266 [Tricharina praecox]|uniref:uncharacterized protein n=1 Tax=Tricharina praecox TaxID=43433 RepID=UPI00221F92DF|nr:uncharacterized protein BZA05DRAFT_342266 [Tricharina praecox]KAI5845496.1 hypothetical protein BZA05DRAFT_342266 [Tricharina praecox]
MKALLSLPVLLIGLCSFVLCTPTPLSPRAAADTVAPVASLSKLTFGGPGCPQTGGEPWVYGTPTQNLTIVFASSAFQASISGDTTTQRTYCQINLAITHAAGTQYAVDREHFGGLANLEEGVRGRHRISYYFSGELETVASEVEFGGPLQREYELDEQVEELWSSCGQGAGLNVNSEVYVTSNGVKGKRGIMTGDFGGNALFELHLKWRAC